MKTKVIVVVIQDIVVSNRIQGLCASNTVQIITAEKNKVGTRAPSGCNADAYHFFFDPNPPNPIMLIISASGPPVSVAAC